MTEVRHNRFKTTCAKCEKVVLSGEGVLEGSKRDGWTTTHEDPKKCVGVTKRRTAARRPVADKVETVEKPQVKARGTKTRTPEMPAAKKTVARKSTRVAVKPKTTAAKPATTPKTPVKRATKKVAAPKVTKPVVEQEEATESALAPELQDMVEAISAQVASGALDAILVNIWDAIEERLDVVESEKPKPAKKTTTRKTTTAPKDKAEKLAPVKRGSKGAGTTAPPAPVRKSATASALAAPLKPRKGFTYRIKEDARHSSAGALIKFVEYVEGSNDRKAVVKLAEDFKTRQTGFQFTCPASAITKK